MQHAVSHFPEHRSRGTDSKWPRPIRAPSGNLQGSPMQPITDLPFFSGVVTNHHHRLSLTRHCFCSPQFRHGVTQQASLPTLHTDRDVRSVGILLEGNGKKPLLDTMGDQHHPAVAPSISQLLTKTRVCVTLIL